MRNLRACHAGPFTSQLNDLKNFYLSPDILINEGLLQPALQFDALLSATALIYLRNWAVAPFSHC
jgi:hypothetical protein